MAQQWSEMTGRRRTLSRHQQYSRDVPKFKDGASAITEVKEFMAECKEELHGLKDIDADIGREKDEYLEQIDATFDELGTLLKKCQSQLKLKAEGDYQKNLDILSRQKKSLESTLQKLTKVLRECDHKKDNEVISKIQQTLKSIPEVTELEPLRYAPLDIEQIKKLLAQLGNTGNASAIDEENDG
jgi:Skp family chaperone for outer membrane proteins